MRFTVWFATGLLLFSLGAPGPARAADPTPIVIVGYPPGTLHPHHVRGPTGFQVASAMFEGLVELDPETSLPMPGLAERWEVDSAGTAWTFHLREGLTWSDGTPLRAQDIANGWRELLTSPDGAAYVERYYCIKDAWELRNADSFVSTILEQTIPTIERLLAASPEGTPDAEEVRARLLATRQLHTPTRAYPESALDLLRGNASTSLSRTEVESLVDDLRERAVVLAAGHRQAVRSFGRTRGVMALGERKLRIIVTHWMPYFPELLTQGCFKPAPSHAAAELLAEAPDPAKIVVSGPFRPTRFVPGESLVLEPNPTWWRRGKRPLPTVEYRLSKGPTRDLAQFLSGAVDVMADLPPVLPSNLQTSPQLHVGPALATYNLRLQARTAGLGDPRIRQAISLAIDRERVLRAFDAPHGASLLGGLVPSGIPGYPEPLAPRHDPEAARRLLAAAGHPGGEGLPVFRYLHNISDSHARIATSIAEQLEEVLGIRLVVDVVPWEEFLSASATGAFEIARGGWIGDYRDPETFLAGMIGFSPYVTNWHPDARLRRLLELAQDPSFFLLGDALEKLPGTGDLLDPESLATLEEALWSTEDPGEFAAIQQRLRMAILREAEFHATQEAAFVIPLYAFSRRLLLSDRVRGWPAAFEVPGVGQVQNAADFRPLRWLRQPED